jgi:molybdenum cofactor biosynthesis enzyme MoaA
MEVMAEEDKREINYLRISITDRCNLRCIYCMSEDGVHFLPHPEVLSYEGHFGVGYLVATFTPAESRQQIKLL